MAKKKAKEKVFAPRNGWTKAKIISHINDVLQDEEDDADFYTRLTVKVPKGFRLKPADLTDKLAQWYVDEEDNIDADSEEDRVDMRYEIVNDLIKKVVKARR